MRTTIKIGVFFAVSYSVFLALAFGIVKRVIPSFVLSIAAIMYAIAALLILTPLLRSTGNGRSTIREAHDSAESRSQRLRAIKAAKIGIVVFTVAFLNAFRYLHSAPLWMVVAGATVNLLIVVGLVVVIEKQTRNLRPQNGS
jgi:hypothetical protein